MSEEVFAYCDAATLESELSCSSVLRERKVNLELKRLANVCIFPYGTVSEELHGEVLSSLAEIVPHCCSGTVYENLSLSQIPVSEDSVCVEEAIYLGAIPICWGHYITDGLSKLWSFDLPEIQQMISRGVPVYFTPNFCALDKTPSAWRHLMDLLGLSHLNVIPLEKPTHFGKLIVPDDSLRNSPEGRLYSPVFMDTISKLVSAVFHKDGGSYPSKVYLSRTRLTSDHAEFGERKIERLFKKAGFKILYPEQMTFEEQVNYLRNAEIVAGTMGSISHNFVFCRPGTETIILRKAWYTNDFQYAINQMANLKVTYIDCHLSVFTNENPNLGPFYMYVNDNVTRFFADRFCLKQSSCFDRRMFMRYVWACITRPDFDKRTVSPSYYYQKMYQELQAHQNLARVVYRSILAHLPQGVGVKIKRFVNSTRK